MLVLMLVLDEWTKSLEALSVMSKILNPIHRQQGVLKQENDISRSGVG